MVTLELAINFDILSNDWCTNQLEVVLTGYEFGTVPITYIVTDPPTPSLIPFYHTPSPNCSDATVSYSVTWDFNSSDIQCLNNGSLQINTSVATGYYYVTITGTID